MHNVIIRALAFYVDIIIMNNQLSYKAFTLIEILIVIVLIGILTVALIPKVIGIQDRAKMVQIKKDMKDIETAVMMSKIDNGNIILLQVTGSGCSDCPCRVLQPLNTLSANHACVVAMTNSINKIAISTGMSTGGLPIFDPRGSPYLIDENEGEVSHSNCTFDHLKNVGKDALFSTSDDIFVSLPSSNCSNKL